MLGNFVKKSFEQENDIVVYDPIPSTMEQKVIDAFDCDCLSALTKMADGQ